MIAYGIRISKEGREEPFGKRNSLALRGICAIEIMLGHLGIATNSIFLFPNRKAGILFVGIFFALSGYGLAYSISNKAQYMDGFLRRRIPKIIIPAFAIHTIGVLLYAWENGWQEQWYVGIINPMAIWTRTNWYVWELIGLYMVFWICEKYGVLRKRYILVLLASVVFVCVAFAFRIDNPWYGSTFCFWIGLEFYEQRGGIKHNVISFPLLKIIGLGFLVGVAILLFFILGEESLVGNLIARNVASVAFVILVLLMLCYMRIGNVASNWLGKYSYEIFLFHPIFIGVLRELIGNNILFSIAVIVCTCLASCVYRFISNCVTRIWSAKKVA